MKTLKLITLFVVILAINSKAQDPKAGVLKPPKYPDGIYTKENTHTRRAIPYTTLREADVMWSKRIWRAIDLKEKINHPLYYPETPTNDRKSFFDVIKEAAVTNGNLTCFDDGTEIEFQKELTKSEIESRLESWDSTHEADDPNNPGATIIAPIKKTVTSGDVMKYYVKEDWFFDKQRSVLDVRIVGIMVILAKKDEKTGDVVGFKPLFSFYFPEARPILANAEVYMRHNDAERRTFDDIFWKRMFSSYILKESNVYDRYISNYTNGLDALLESEKIKTDIFNFEHDMWHF